MLEKDKDYVEFILRCTSVEMGEDKCHCEVGFNGYSNDDFPCMPMDVVCKEFDHKVVLVSKRDFDRLQADNEHYRELAKQREENYNLLLKKIGFDSVIEFENFLVRMGKKEDGSHKTVKEILQEIDPISFEVLLQQEHTIYEWKELTGCSTPEEAKSVIEFGESRYHAYNKINEKFEQLQTENEQLKKKLQVPDPIPEYKELLEKLYSKDDAENLEWTLNHICGGQASVNGWMVTAKLWRRNYETLSKLVGFSSVEEIQDYLTNEAECDTLQEALAKLKDQVKYTCDEWYSANSRNNSWKAAAECNSPKELIEKREALEKEIDVYSRTLKEWKEGTGCPSPSSAKALIESGMSYEYAYHEAQEENRKLTEEVDSWKNVTGYSTPEDYMHARINCATPFDYTAAWQAATGCSTPEEVKEWVANLGEALLSWHNATGCNTPEQAKERIKALNERIDESEADYNHLLMLTGFSDEGEIEDALDKNDHSTLRKALVDYEFDYENLLKLTGYKSEHDIRVLLNNSEQFVYESVRELINSLKRKAKFTESNWQKVTGFSIPEKCSSYIDRLEKKLEDIKNLTEED